MNRYCFLALGATLLFALTAHAQQPANSGTAPAKAASSTSGPAGLPPVETQLQVLTEKLSLTSEQQGKIKPILKELHDATEKLVLDKSLSPDERLERIRPQRYKADEKIRAILSDDQKKKLDQYEQGPHPEMHGNLNGAASPQH